MSTEQDQESEGVSEILGGAGALGTALAGAGSTAAVSAAAVAPLIAAGTAGYAIGTGIEHATGGVISDTISDGLMGLVGDEESYAAAQSFDDGNYLEGAGHMASGAYDTVSDAAGDVYDSAADTASGAWDTVTDTASGVYDTVTDTVSDTYDTVSDAASDALDYINPFD
jgi:hypothetical protein